MAQNVIEYKTSFSSSIDHRSVCLYIVECVVVFCFFSLPSHFTIVDLIYTLLCTAITTRLYAVVRIFIKTNNEIKSIASPG